MGTPIIPGFFTEPPSEEEQEEQEKQRKAQSVFLPPGDVKQEGELKPSVFVPSGETAAPADILAPGVPEQQETMEQILGQLDEATARRIGQAIGTFAPDAAEVVQEPPQVTRQPFSLAEREAAGVSLLTPLGLNDIIENSVRAGMQIPIRHGPQGLLSSIEDPTIPGIKAIRGPIGSGVIGGTVRSAINMTQALANDPAGTVLGLAYAPLLITMGGLQEFIQGTPLPGEDLDAFRERFVELVGRMSPEQAAEARRAFQGLLAATVVGRGLGGNIGRGAPRRGIVAAQVERARALGASRAEALAQGELLATRIQVTGALAAFGAFGAEEGERTQNAVAFGLSAIPLGLTFAALNLIGRQVGNLNNVLARAAIVSQSRSARPLDVVSTPIPEVRAGVGIVPVGRTTTLDVRTNPDFVPRFTREETATIAAESQVREIKSGIPDPPPVPESSIARADERARVRIRITEIEERRRAERREREEAPIVERRVAEERRGPTRTEIDADVGLTESIAESPAELEIAAQARKAEETTRIEDPENVPFNPNTPEPVVPAEVAGDLAVFIKNNGELVESLVESTRLQGNQTVVIPNVETPAGVLASVRANLGPDFRVAIHPRVDGTFDVAIGGRGSPLEIVGNRTQFIKEGHFNGQRASFKGTDYEYVGSSGKNDVLLRKPGTPEVITVDASSVRRVKDVKSINEFDKVADTQRGLPERAMLRVQSAQISQLYGWVLEHVGDLTHRMSQGIDFFKGQFGEVRAKVDRTLRSLTSEFGFEKELNQQIANNQLIRSNPGVSRQEMTRILLERNPRSITADTGTLRQGEQLELARLKQLGRDYADAHREVPIVNRVQRLAQEAAIAMGEFNFEGARNLLRELSAELDKGPKNWQEVTRESTVPTAREALEGIFTEAELQTYDQLFPEIQPQDAVTADLTKFTQDAVRSQAATNGYDVERNVSGTFTVRDIATGQEQLRSNDIRKVDEFINKSGQDEGVVIDGGSPIDTDVPGSISPPPPPGGRPNEPFPFPPETWAESIQEAFTAGTPFLAPFKDWAAAADGILGSNILSEVYLKTQRTKEVSSARQRIHLETVSDMRKQMNKAGISESRHELMTGWIETRSHEQMISDPKTGESLFKSRRVTEEEVLAGDLLAELDVDTKRVFGYIRQVTNAVKIEAERLRIEVKQMDPERVREIDAEIRDGLKMLPNELVAADLFNQIKTRDLNEISLYATVRLADAKRTNALSRTEYAAQNKMTAEELKIAGEIDAKYEEVAAIEDIPISDAQLIRGYSAHYAENKTATPEAAYLNQKGTNNELKWVNSMIRTGEIDPYSMDPIANLARYIRGAFDSVAFNKAWNEAVEFSKTIQDPLAREVTKSYLNNIRGNLPASTRWTQRIVDTTFEKLGLKLDVRVRKDLVDSYMAMANAAFMGARPGLAARDLMQWVFFHYSRYGDGVLGTQRTANALKASVNSRGEASARMRAEGDLPTIGIIEFDTPAELLNSSLGKPLGNFPKAIRNIAEAGLTASGQRTAYEFAYRGTLLESRQFVGDALTKFQNGDLTKAETYERIRLDSFNRATRSEFDKLVTENRFQEANELLGRQSAREMLAEFGKANHPWGWNTNLGRLMTHYGTWSSNAAQFVMGGMSRGSKKTRLGFATRFAMTQSALFATGRFVGLDFGRWFTLPGLFFTGGPALQTAELIVTAMTGYGNDRDIARGRLMQLFPQIDWNNPTNSDLRSMFFPGSYVIEDVRMAYDAFNRGDNPFKVAGRAVSIPIDRKASVLDGGEF